MSRELGECFIQSVNEHGQKLRVNPTNGKVSLARNGTKFRLHEWEESGAHPVSVCLEIVGLSKEAGKFAYLSYNDLSNQLEIRTGSKLSPNFYIHNGMFSTMSYSFEANTGLLPRWLRHTNWTLRVDPRDTGHNFKLDASFLVIKCNATEPIRIGATPAPLL